MIGIVTLRQDGTLEYANLVARSIAARRDAFTLGAQGIQALRASDQQRINAALATMQTASAPGGIAVGLPRSNGKPDYLLQLCRPAPAQEAQCAAATALEWRILDPQSVAVPGAGLLRQLFKLTATQAALAQRLAAGERHAEAAAALGIRISTVRAHLTEIYRKTQTSNTVQLVRLLMLVAVSMNAATEHASFIADGKIDAVDRCEQR